jgi:hypothetical protein
MRDLWERFVGVLNDYFRAPDASAVARLMELTDGGPVGNSHEPPVDVVDAKGVEPVVTLGKLVSFVLNVPWDLHLVETKLVWPAKEDAGEDYEGPWVVVLDDQTRATLAGIPDAELPEFAARWAQIEELSGYGDLPPDIMIPVLTELVALARRAEEVNDHLYCWICL